MLQAASHESMNLILTLGLRNYANYLHLRETLISPSFKSSGLTSESTRML